MHHEVISLERVKRKTYKSLRRVGPYEDSNHVLHHRIQDRGDKYNFTTDKKGMLMFYLI